MVVEERDKNCQNYFIFVVLTAEYLVSFTCYSGALFKILYNNAIYINDVDELTKYLAESKVFSMIQPVIYWCQIPFAIPFSL
jgi:hypothetical protein